MRSMALAVLLCLGGAAWAAEPAPEPQAVKVDAQRVECKACKGMGIYSPNGGKLTTENARFCGTCRGSGFLLLIGKNRVPGQDMTAAARPLYLEKMRRAYQERIRECEQEKENRLRQLADCDKRLTELRAKLADFEAAQAPSASPPAKAEDKPKPVMKVELLPSPAEKEAPAGG